MTRLDQTDKILLNELKKDSKQSIKDLSAKVKLSISPTHERVKKLERLGVIRGYSVVLDYTLLERNFLVYLQVILVRHNDEVFQKFEAFIKENDEIEECSYVTGEYDFLLKIRLTGMDEYQNFIIDKISQLEIIAKIQSSFILKQIKDNYSV